MSEQNAEKVVRLTPEERGLLLHATHFSHRTCEHLTPAVEQIIAARLARLTGDDMAAHIQNWVPLGYDYPDKDPYPNAYEAARAILAEVATSLSLPPATPTP